jgi:hypothetical protein
MKLFPMSFTPVRKAAAACAVVALGSIAAPSYALTVYELNVPAGATYGTVSLTQVDADTVAVHAVLSAGYNFVDTGNHEAFGFSVAGSPTVTDIAPASGYTATGAFTQPNFGDFLEGVACPSPTPCQGGNNSSTPNNTLDFNVNMAGITEASFVANALGFTFTADLIGSGSTPVPFVPEPETYALMLAGLGVVGFVARRRRA